MSTVDIVSVVIAGGSVALAAIAVPMMAVRLRRHRTDDDHPASDPFVPSPDTVSVRLGTGREHHVWQLAAQAGHAVTIDILTYRPQGGDGVWCHELMEAPLRLGAGARYDLLGPPLGSGTAFDVAVGWFCDGRPDSQFVTVRVEDGAAGSAV